MKKDQSGFTVVEGLLILVIVAIIGGLGWYVYKQRNIPSYSNSNSYVSTSTTNTPKNKEFVNKDFGFKFSYPTDWGIARVEKSLIETKTGKAYTIRFSKFPEKLLSGFVTKDWSAKDEADATATMGFVAYQGCKISGTETEQAYLYKSDTSCVAVNGGITTCPGCGTSKSANLKLQAKFTKSKTIAGLEFMYAAVVVKDFQDSTLKHAFNYNKMDQGFIEIAKTVQEL